MPEFVNGKVKEKMTDEQKPSDADTNVYVRLPEDVLKKLDVKAAELRIKRPGAIADAVRLWLEIKSAESNKSVELPTNRVYDFRHVAAAIEKSALLKRLLGELISELQKATGEKIAPANRTHTKPEPTKFEKFVNDATPASDDAVGEVAEAKAELQKDKKHPRRGKQSGG